VRGRAASWTVERVAGIGPAFSAWEADVLPLNYTRVETRDRSEYRNANRTALDRSILEVPGSCLFHLNGHLGVPGLERLDVIAGRPCGVDPNET
jgi:hypothetical protein